MAKTDPALIAGAATGELARGSLRLVDAIAISVSVIAPGMAMLLNVTGVAAVSGGSTPLAFLLGGIACLALAFVVIGFTRRMAAAVAQATHTMNAAHMPPISTRVPSQGPTNVVAVVFSATGSAPNFGPLPTPKPMSIEYVVHR